jgi:hypothetical protein
MEFSNDGAFVRVRLANGTTNADLDNQVGFNTVSGVLDFDAKKFTIFYNGAQQMLNTVDGYYAFAGQSNTFASFGNIEIFAPTAGTDYRPLSIDDFMITAVPEPSTYALLMGGFGLLICLVRRHSQKAARAA